jgi:hypothetical protein
MKQKTIFKGTLTMILMLFACLSISSCMDHEDDYDYNNGGYVYQDFVSIVRTSTDSCYFIGSTGNIYIPSKKYVNEENITCGYIYFYITQDMSTSAARKYIIKLFYDVVPLDRPLVVKPTAEDWNYLRNDSLISVSANGFLNDTHLLIGANYYYSGKVKHEFTLCYAENTGFHQSSSSTVADTLCFELRHNAKDEQNTTETVEDFLNTSNDMRQANLAYNIADIVKAARTKNGGKEIYIDVCAKIRTIGQPGYSIYHTGLNASTDGIDISNDAKTYSGFKLPE